MIEDIGSGVNFNRRGLNKIIDLAVGGRVNQLVIAYKDRLARVGYELIERLIREYSGGEIIIIEAKDDMEPEEELMNDVMDMMNVFVAKRNGLRKYKRNENKNNKI
jgi:putative resolvase